MPLTNRRVSHSSFNPAANEGEKHRRAKDFLVDLCRGYGMDAETEVCFPTQYKTYYADVRINFTHFGKKIMADLEIEDHDHSTHDYQDAINKVKEMKRNKVKTIWFKSYDIIGRKALSPAGIFAKILNELIDGNERDPRMNI